MLVFFSRDKLGSARFELGLGLLSAEVFDWAADPSAHLNDDNSKALSLKGSIKFQVRLAQVRYVPTYNFMYSISKRKPNLLKFSTN